MDPDKVINGYGEKVKGVTVKDVLKARSRMLEKIKKVKVFKNTIDKIGLSYCFIRDTTTGKYSGYSGGTVALLVSGLAYLALPVDIVPDWIPMGGWLDDSVVLGWIFTQCSEELKKYDAFRKRCAKRKKKAAKKQVELAAETAAKLHAKPPENLPH